MLHMYTLNRVVEDVQTVNVEFDLIGLTSMLNVVGDL
jgi:hypothetical protein